MQAEVRIRLGDDNRLTMEASPNNQLVIVGLLELAKVRLLNPVEPNQGSGIALAHAIPDLRATSPFGRLPAGQAGNGG